MASSGATQLLVLDSLENPPSFTSSVIQTSHFPLARRRCEEKEHFSVAHGHLLSNPP